MLRPSTDRLAVAVLLCAVLLASFYAGVLFEGRRVARAATVELQDLQRRHARTTAWLRGERTEAEASLRHRITTLENQLSNDQKEADAAHNTHLAGLGAGTVRVHVPVVLPASCQPAGIQPPGLSGAEPGPTYAELDPAAAASLAGISHDGDQAIRELNHCIAQYGEVKQAFTAWRQKLQELDHAQTP
ncbi:hypothetical protein [Comamonas terrigena]|uniref:hypothetical protein n=1 Tax=Comamonas terrigena TaxID=32013 RepID=UPI0028AF47C4|nr:hypothetical protein [Comamonas terrigena]